MKLLMIYCDSFAYNPTVRTLETADENAKAANFEKVQTAFIQVEAEDTEKENDVVKKLLKNLKWVCGKNNTRKVVLHSFAHLSESKAEPEFTKHIFDRVEERLKNTGYEVFQTPFGYFLDLQVDAPGFSLARVFKSF
jgi:uncharacterized protein YpuA (DUF1002 family)